jgi:hypothetical protein
MLISDLEKSIPDLYSAQGLYAIFRMGYFPVPYLWEGGDTFARAVNWTTKIKNGGIHLVDDFGAKMNIQDRLLEIKNRSTLRRQRS